MKLLRNIYSDWMKTKNTPIRLLIYIVPLLYTSIILLYTSRVRTQEYIYIVFFQLLSVSFPIAEGLLCALLCKLEEDAGGFKNLLGANSRIVAYSSKFLLTVFITIFEVSVSAILLIVGIKFILNVPGLHYSIFLFGTFFTLLGSIFLIEIHLVISFIFGFGPSMAVGGAGFLAAAIIGCSIAGEDIWIYFPWSWSARLTTMLGNYNEQLIYSSLIISIITILLFILSIIWFCNWEGKKAYE